MLYFSSRPLRLVIKNVWENVQSRTVAWCRIWCIDIIITMKYSRKEQDCSSPSSMSIYSPHSWTPGLHPSSRSWPWRSWVVSSSRNWGSFLIRAYLPFSNLPLITGEWDKALLDHAQINLTGRGRRRRASFLSWLSVSMHMSWGIDIHCVVNYRDLKSQQDNMLVYIYIFFSNTL